MDESSTAILERVRQGDPGALAQFVQQHRGPLTAYISRLLSDALRSRVDPEDIVQETAAAAMRALGQGERTEKDLFGWLCDLADQRIVDAYRRHVRAQKRSVVREARVPRQGGGSSRLSFAQLLQASFTTPSQAAVRSEQEQKVLDALETLPADQRDAIRLHFLEGLPSKEIARRLGKDDVAVRVMLSRSIQRLRRLLSISSSDL
jgi:RNA polymerase sigma-70 factor, ECF subfamily